MRTQLPKNWCIKIDGGDISKSVRDYANKNNLNRSSWKFDVISTPYYYIDHKGLFQNSLQVQGEEITFEEFEVLVLGKNINYEIF